MPATIESFALLRCPCRLTQGYSPPKFTWHSPHVENTDDIARTTVEVTEEGRAINCVYSGEMDASQCRMKSKRLASSISMKIPRARRERAEQRAAVDQPPRDEVRDDALALQPSVHFEQT